MAERLDRLQRRFLRLVMAPTGVAPEVHALERDDPEGVPLRRWIRAPDECGAAKRLDVYANMYFYRLLEVLTGDYPKLAAVLGGPAMHNLVTDYVWKCPSDNPSLRHFGRHLPSFLRSHSLGSQRPELIDLAELEWARVEAFDAVKEPTLGRKQVAALPADRWPARRFKPVASMRRLNLSYPADRLWWAIDSGEPQPALAAEPTHVVVWRRRFVVHHRTTDPLETAALAQLAEGRPFASLCEMLAGDDRSEDDAARAAVALLLRWVDEGLLAA